MGWRDWLGLCKHEWKTIEEYIIRREDQKTPVGNIYVLQCKHCGALKTHKVMP